MRGKFNLALFLIGLPPVLGLVGFYLWMALNQAPAAPRAATVNMAVVNATVPILQRDVASISSSLFNAIKKTNEEFPNLVAHNSDTDLDNFVSSHPGVTGIAVLSMNGKLQKTLPSTVNLVDPSSYASSDEFQNILAHFKEQGNNTYKFYTQRLGYPAFLFTIPISSDTFVEAAFNLGTFFRDYDAKGGDFFILDGSSGKYLYHSNPAKLAMPFNPNQESWLTKVQTDLSHNQGGSSLNGSQSAAVYSPLNIGEFGVVHTIPLSAIQPASAAKAAKTFPDNLVDFLQAPEGFAGMIALLVALAWVFIVGSLCYGIILGPLRKAGAVVLNAAQGKGALTADSARRFGKNEIGRMVEAVAMLTQKLEQDKQEMTQEREEALRRGRAEVEAKSKEAAAQVSAAQQQAQAARGELNDKNQQLNDKLKELDAMKGMQEGLRTQNEQAKAENAKLKGQISEIGQTQADFQKKIAETQVQLKDMESKMLQAVSAASAIQVSQVRAAAIRTMAEELKTTLGIIKGYVSSALGTAQAGISEKQQEFLGMVINRSARLEKFINDLLDIYQVEIEQLDAKKEEVNLASEIEGLAFNFQAQAEVKNIKMKVEAKGTIPSVPIVRRRFNQLWNILYLQIIKDAPRGSSIPITVETIGDNVKVTVQDPGLVVVPEHLPKLFDEFYDPKHPASPQLAGTGLKFALVKTILAAHGGGAVAEKADPGTRLLLTFATKAKKAAAPAMPAAGPSVAPSPTLPPKAPAIMPPGGIGAPKTAAPGVTPSIGLPKPPPPPGPAAAPKPAAPSAPGAPVPAGSTASAGSPQAAPGGILDALISGKVPSVSAPGLKPPPGPGLPPPPGLGVPAPGSTAPKPPLPGMPAPPSPGPVTPPPAASKPASGLLDALLEKKPPVPGSTPSAKPVVSPLTGPGQAGPPQAGASPVPPAPVAPPKPAGSVPPLPGLGSAPKPPIPGAAPKPPLPGIPAPGVPSVPSAAPKVVPTSIKPTTPPPGILDLDNTDSFKVSAPPAAPKPPGSVAPPAGIKPPTPSMPPPGAPRPPLPGAPVPPAGAPRPSIPPMGMPPGLKPPVPPPGIPPGGLNPNSAAKKEGDGELIE